jgi:hypothetical protein
MAHHVTDADCRPRLVPDEPARRVVLVMQANQPFRVLRFGSGAVGPV